VLHAQARVKQPQVLRDLGDGRDGRLARATRDALLDRDSRRNSRQAIDRGARQLLDELPRIRRHRLHEPPLALGEHDVEGERGFARAGHARDHVELPVRNRQREIFEIVLARTNDREIARTQLERSRAFGGHRLLAAAA
jgi:hypothetical protein